MFYLIKETAITCLNKYLLEIEHRNEEFICTSKNRNFQNSKQWMKL